MNETDEPIVRVLDHGFVRLVDSMGSDLSIVRAARVSHNADWRAGENEGSDRRLIDYLMRNRHTSPFEAVTFTFEVKAPIFILRQWHRHRMWSYNEISARYTELDEGFYVPDPELIGEQSKSNKQAREINPDAPSLNAEEQCQLIRHTCETAFMTYKSLLAQGVPREIARSVLPVAAYSRMFASVDLHNLFHCIRLRIHPHSQFEVQVYAKALLDLIDAKVPAAVAAFRRTL